VAIANVSAPPSGYAVKPSREIERFGLMSLQTRGSYRTHRAHDAERWAVVAG